MQNRSVNDRVLGASVFRTILQQGLGLLLVLVFLGGREAQGQVNVTTYHYDNQGTGQNLNESTLAPANVNPITFGKLFSYPVDGFVYAQPLYLSGVFIPGRGMHNVVFVATEHDSVYAFDADNPNTASGGGQLWKRSFINPGDGITTVPTGFPVMFGVNNDVNSSDIVPEVGITSTPVINYNPDTGTGTLYVVVKTKEVRGIPPNVNNHYVQKLHALDVGTGADTVEPDGELIGDTIWNGGNTYIHDPANPCVPGTGDGTSGGQVCFNALRQLNRPGLALVNGVIYIDFASHGDNGPYHGWILGYNTTGLDLVAKFNTTPNGGLGGIWEGAGAPVFDADGNVYVATGNGTFRFDADGRKNYGDSVIKLSTTPTSGVLPVLDFFTPFEQATLNSQDADQGSGGAMLLPDQPGDHPHLIMQTGKRGKIYLMDRDNLGGYRHGVGCDQEPVLETCDGVVQFTPNGTIGGSFDTPAYFNTGLDQFVYYGGTGDKIKAFRFNPATGKLDLPPASQSSANFGFTGVTPTISALGTDNPILWALNVNGYGVPARPQPSPMILFAYDATDLSNLLYSSDQTGVRDRMGNGVKFNTPTVANGHVYVGTQTTVDVFGLFDVATELPAAPSNLSATPGPPAPAPPSIVLTWTNNANNATGVKIERSLDGTNFTLISTAGRNDTSFTDTTVLASTVYFYRVRATNQIGDSDPSNVANAKTHIAGPALQVSDICGNSVVLSWTATADDHYTIARSLDGITFTTIGTVDAGTTTFTDPGLPFGTYFYRVTAFNSDGDNANSNIMSATVGPAGVDHSGGFAGAKDITVNGSAAFTGNVLELTDGKNSEAGSAFANTQVGVRRFTTSFTYQARPGTTPMADGTTFIIQSNSPMSLGNSGGGMGFQNIPRSVAVKLDLFNHGHGGYSTGLYVDGHNPDVPGPGEADINLVGTPIDLTSGHPFRVDLSYDSTSLSLVETITDTVTGGSLTIDDYPPVDIPAHVNSDTAFVGFGAGTGGLNAFQDIQNWTFTADESGLPPRKPTNLAVTNIEEVDGTFNVTIAWKCNNAYTATGFKIERSTDGTNFTEIAQVDISQTTFTDPGLAPGQYFYRVRSFNATANSAYSAVACVPVGGPTVNHRAGFACHGDLTSNGSASFTGTLARLTDGGGSEAASTFSNSKVGIAKFATTFSFQIHTPGSNPFADGMTFVIQSNSPTALGGSGGGLGYGSDTPGGTRGIRNSIVIKFDIYQNATETDNSTGLFSDGRSPTVEESGSGDLNVPIDKAVLDLKSQDVFRVDLTYDGTTLTEVITDTTTSRSFTKTYTVDIPGKVGGTTAFVGFTAGTGGLTATQDVQTWTFQTMP